MKRSVAIVLPTWQYLDLDVAQRDFLINYLTEFWATLIAKSYKTPRLLCRLQTARFIDPIIWVFWGGGSVLERGRKRRSATQRNLEAAIYYIPMSITMRNLWRSASSPRKSPTVVALDKEPEVRPSSDHDREMETLRHMIGNAAHDLKTVIKFLPFISF